MLFYFIFYLSNEVQSSEIFIVANLADLCATESNITVVVLLFALIVIPHY